MTGREVAATLQTRYHGLRVIYLSGYAEHLVIQRGVIEEGTAFIPKPFDPLNLARTVREVLDGQSADVPVSPLRSGRPVTACC